MPATDRPGAGGLRVLVARRSDDVHELDDPGGEAGRGAGEVDGVAGRPPRRRQKVGCVQPGLARRRRTMILNAGASAPAVAGWIAPYEDRGIEDSAPATRR